MKIDEQHLLPEHLAFYRRRLFWGVIFGIFFIFSTVLFIYALSNTGSSHKQNFYDIYTSFTISYAATLFRLIPFSWLNGYGEYLGSALYFISMMFLVCKTFQKDYVHIKYPIILSILYITGLLPLLFLNGF